MSDVKIIYIYKACSSERSLMITCTNCATVFVMMFYQVFLFSVKREYVLLPGSSIEHTMFEDICPTNSKSFNNSTKQTKLHTTEPK